MDTYTVMHFVAWSLAYYLTGGVAWFLVRFVVACAVDILGLVLSKLSESDDP